MTADPSARPYDIILFGATGFTGQLVAEYLADHYTSSGLRWALAGRNAAKLEVVRANLRERSNGRCDPSIVIADSHDRASLDVVANQTNVVCSTVGPYAKYGDSLVAACVAAGTAYCDLTGEVQWVRRMIDEHHSAAQRSGARIVHCCGFDSIPSDLGTQLLVEEAVRLHGRAPDHATLYVGATRGGFSGGTVASLLNVLDEASDRAVRRVLGNPYSLCPEGEQRGPDRGDPNGVSFDRDEKRWIGPFLMAAVNSRVVRRSNALLNYAYGRTFQYREVTRLGAGPGAMLQASALAAGLGGFVVAASIKPVRRMLLPRVLPAPGEGPSRAAIESGFFKIEIVGRYTDGTPEVRVAVRGTLDPGYGATAAMLSEAATCLALDAAKTNGEGGVLTPASAMGSVLRERLNVRGVVSFSGAST